MVKDSLLILLVDDDKAKVRIKMKRKKNRKFVRLTKYKSFTLFFSTFKKKLKFLKCFANGADRQTSEALNSHRFPLKWIPKVNLMWMHLNPSHHKQIFDSNLWANIKREANNPYFILVYIGWGRMLAVGCSVLYCGVASFGPLFSLWKWNNMFNQTPQKRFHVFFEKTSWEGLEVKLGFSKYAGRGSKAFLLLKIFKKKERLFFLSI